MVLFICIWGLCYNIQTVCFGGRTLKNIIILSVLFILMVQFVLFPCVTAEPFEENRYVSFERDVSIDNTRSGDININLADFNNFTSGADMWGPFLENTSENGRLISSAIPPSIINFSVSDRISSKRAFLSISPIHFDYQNILCGASEFWVRAPFHVNSSHDFYLTFSIIHTMDFNIPRMDDTFFNSVSFPFEFDVWGVPEMASQYFYDSERHHVIYQTDYSNIDTRLWSGFIWGLNPNSTLPPPAYYRYNSREAFKQYDSVLSDGTNSVTYNFTYLNVKAPVYSGESYYFMFYYWENNSDDLDLYVTESDMYRDDLTFTKLYFENDTEFYDIDIPVDLALDIMGTHGISEGLTGYEIPGEDLGSNPEDFWYFDYYVPISGISLGDYVTFSMPYMNTINNSLSGFAAVVYLTPSINGFPHDAYRDALSIGFMTENESVGFWIDTKLEDCPDPINEYHIEIGFAGEYYDPFYLYMLDVNRDLNISTIKYYDWYKVGTRVKFGDTWEERIGFQPVTFLHETDGIWTNTYIEPIVIYEPAQEEIVHDVEISQPAEVSLWTNLKRGAVSGLEFAKDLAVFSVVMTIHRYTHIPPYVIDAALRAGWDAFENEMRGLRDSGSNLLGWIIDGLEWIYTHLNNFAASVVAFFREAVTFTLSSLELLLYNITEVTVVFLSVFSVCVISIMFRKILKFPELLGIYGFDVAMDYAENINKSTVSFVSGGIKRLKGLRGA